jgi:hypothetical protein
LRLSSRQHLGFAASPLGRRIDRGRQNRVVVHSSVGDDMQFTIADISDQGSRV